MPRPDLPRFDRSKETPLQQTLRAFATGALIGCLLMSPFVSWWLILIGVVVFVLTGVVGGIVEAAQENRRNS